MRKSYLVIIAVALAIVGAGFAKRKSSHRTAVASVVKLEIGSTGFATGFAVLTPSGRTVILTNWHVCRHLEDGAKISAQGQELELISLTAAKDLCALTNLPKTPLSPLKVSLTLETWTPLTTIGYPGGKGPRVSTGVYIEDSQAHLAISTDRNGQCEMGTQAVIVGFTSKGPVLICDLLITLGDTSMFAYPGSSGSPVLNEESEVVGVMNSTDNVSGNWYGSMVLLSDVKEFLQDL